MERTKKSMTLYVVQQYHKGWITRKTTTIEETAKDFARTFYETCYPYHAYPVRIKKILALV